MKKYFGLSLILHMLPFVILLVLSLLGIVEKQKQGLEGAKGKKGEMSGVTIDVIEMIPDSGKDASKEDKRKFYWGIGVTVAKDFVDVPGWSVPLMATKIDHVYNGYSADNAGLQRGDMIILIDDRYIDSENDLIGEAPKKMVLTIVRNGAIIKVQLDRCKVYY